LIAWSASPASAEGDSLHACHLGAASKVFLEALTGSLAAGLEAVDLLFGLFRTFDGDADLYEQLSDRGRHYLPA
jgi:hypothetical protein